MGLFHTDSVALTYSNADFANGRGLDCLVFQSKPFTSRPPAGKVLLKCRTYLSEGRLSKLQISW